MPRRPPAKARRATRTPTTRVGPYHHGDLPRALLAEAVHIIQEQGVESLTLRGVGERLGVSRTALYRHFSSKQALLGSVAAEGFRTLRAELIAAYEAAARGRHGFEEMGLAYVRFAIGHPSHYRVMFGGYVSVDDIDPDRTSVGADAFQVLVDAIVEQQQAGLVRGDDPRMLAVYIWSVVHGVAMLALDGMLKPPADADTLMMFANERLRTGIELMAEGSLSCGREP
jgi:AcrR family transcriptional regulator